MTAEVQLGRATAEEIAADQAWQRQWERQQKAVDYIRSCDSVEAELLHAFASQNCSTTPTWMLLLLLPPDELVWLLDHQAEGWDKYGFKIERVDYSPDFPPGVVQ